MVASLFDKGNLEVAALVLVIACAVVFLVKAIR